MTADRRGLYYSNLIGRDNCGPWTEEACLRRVDVELTNLIGSKVVLDTAGSMIYLGLLEAVTPEGFWLSGADVHDRGEGHMNKEQYVIEARKQGICTNRQRVLVMRSVVMSISALDDIVAH